MYKLLEVEWLTTELKLCRDRNQEGNKTKSFKLNENTTFPNLCNTMKAVLWDKFITLSAYVKKNNYNQPNREISFNNVMTYLKGL